jgi:hypothetical protein
MSVAKMFRPALALVTMAAVGLSGIGAVVIGAILASKSRDRHREVYHEPPRDQRFDQHRYHHPAPHVNQAPSKQYDPPKSGS